MAMLSALDNLPEDPAELRQVSELLAADVKALTLKVEQLQHQLHGANRHRFGSKSEGMVEQTALAALLEPKAKPKRKPLPEHLERIEQILSVGGDCPECGGDVSKLGEDITEELEYIPGCFVVNKII
jgi:transposase